MHVFSHEIKISTLLLVTHSTDKVTVLNPVSFLAMILSEKACFLITA
jgi:hypothetical protein